MAKSDDDRKKATHNNEVRSKIRTYQKEYDNKMAEHRKAGERLERLKNAQKDLKKQMSTLSDFKSDLKNSTKNVPTSAFKGDRRDKYEHNIDQMVDELQKLHDKHDENMLRLDMKINEAQLEKTALGDAVAQVGAVISGLFAAILD